MGKLSDILRNGNGSGDIRDLWNKTTAAGELPPLPPGTYDAVIVKGELTQSRTNATPGYRLEFVVSEGEFRNRRVWLDCWLTAPALPQTKRDVAKLGVTDLSQLEQPLPARFKCKVKVARRKDDNGEEYNRVRRFDVTGIEEIPRDAFAPDDDAATVAAAVGPGDAAEPPAAETGTDPDTGTAATDGTPSEGEGNDSGAAGNKPPF